MLERLRETYYRRRFGKPEATLRLRIDHLQRSVPWEERVLHPVKPGIAERLQWLETLPAADRLEGMELLVRQAEIREGREKAVKVITHKNRCRMLVDELMRRDMEGPSSWAEDFKLAQAEAELLIAAQEVERVKRGMREAEQDYKARLAAFEARCGSLGSEA